MRSWAKVIMSYYATFGTKSFYDNTTVSSGKCVCVCYRRFVFPFRSYFHIVFGDILIRTITVVEQTAFVYCFWTARASSDLLDIILGDVR